jgi:hypothetical protein
MIACRCCAGRQQRCGSFLCGGESGPGKRPTDLAWHYSLRDQCRAQGVAFYEKQVDKVRPIPPDLMIRQFPATTNRR